MRFFVLSWASASFHFSAHARLRMSSKSEQSTYTIALLLCRRLSWASATLRASVHARLWLCHSLSENKIVAEVGIVVVQYCRRNAPVGVSRRDVACIT